MKKILSILMMTIWMCACSSDQSSTATNAAVNTEQNVKQDAHAGHDHAGHDHSGHDHSGHDHSTHVKASAEAPWIGFWAVEFGVRPSDKTYAEKVKGKWYNLKKDNTFEYGLYQKDLGKGTWKIDEKTSAIQLSFENKPADDFPNEWKVLGVGDAMIWLGNTTTNNTGAQVKFLRENGKPSK